MKTKLKNILYTIVVLILFTSSLILDIHAQPKNDNQTEKKLTICHYPKGNSENVQEIEINENSLDTHLEHGDYIKKENEECKSKAVEVPIPIPTTLEPVNQPIPEPINPVPTNPTTYEPINLPTSYPSQRTLGATTQNALPTTQNIDTNNLYYNLYPVYRFLNILNPDAPRHFYTISRTEMEYIRDNLAYEWKLEGIAYLAWIDNDPLNITCINGRTSVYRFFSSSLSNHLYTIDENEKNQLMNNSAYIFEGVKYCVYPNQVGGTNPVYRFFHTGYGKHFYTISEKEKDDTITEYNRLKAIYEGAGVPFYYWTFEDIKFYAIPYNSFYGDLYGRARTEATSNDKKIGESDFMCGGYKFVIYQNSSNKIQVGDYVYNPSVDQFFWIMVENNFVSAYYSYINHCDVLGLPIGNSATAAVSRYQSSGEYQMYEKGGIYYSSYGTFAVYGKIFEIYETENATPGTGGNYGFPVEAARPYPEYNNSTCQQFEGGLICEEENTEPQPIDLDADGLDDNLENELMYKYAPVIYLDKDEEYLPANVDWFLQYSQLKLFQKDCDTQEFDIDEKNYTELTNIVNIKKGPICYPLTDQFIHSGEPGPSIDDDHYYFLDFWEFFHEGSENKADWYTYTRVYKNNNGGINLQYWYFFPYNDPAFFLSLGGWEHQGDWEHITVELDSENNPLFVHYAEHTNIDPGSTVCWDVKSNTCKTDSRVDFDFSVLKIDGTHPEVLIAEGSHASYPKVGTLSNKESSFQKGGDLKTWYTWKEGSLLNMGEMPSYKEGAGPTFGFARFSGRWGRTRPYVELGIHSFSPKTMTYQLEGWNYNQ
jgi:hypothetical protein